MLVLGIVFAGLYFTIAQVSRGFDTNDRVILEAIERKLGVDLRFIKKFIR